MINYIWFIMIFFGLIVGIFTGNGEGMSNAIISSINSTVTFIIGLVGLMCFWCGVMKVAQNSGFTEKLAKLMKPILKIIFKDAAKDEKVLGAIVMNITANMMGLGNAATPFGIKAMEEMDRLNSIKCCLYSIGSINSIIYKSSSRFYKSWSYNIACNNIYWYSSYCWGYLL